jgi:HAD superfamily hydrolase (TIGR01509 family)
MRNLNFAFLFDFDGTLVDTMPFHYQAYKRVFASVGLSLSEHHFYSCIGGKATDTIKLFLNGQTSPLSITELHQRKKDLLEEIINENEIPQLETSKLIETLKPFFTIGLVSSGSSRGINQMLDKLGWGEVFDAVVTGDDVIRGKPHPEPYITIAEILKINPINCLVFEDTDDGIKSAELAGMKVFDVRKTIPAYLNENL